MDEAWESAYKAILLPLTEKTGEEIVSTLYFGVSAINLVLLTQHSTLALFQGGLMRFEGVLHFQSPIVFKYDLRC